MVRCGLIALCYVQVAMAEGFDLLIEWLSYGLSYAWLHHVTGVYDKSWSNDSYKRCKVNSPRRVLGHVQQLMLVAVHLAAQFIPLAKAKHSIANL